MSNHNILLKKTDKGYVFDYQIVDENNAPIDLTNSTVTFKVGDKTVMYVNNIATITDAPNGEVQYTFTEQDTLTSGGFLGEFEVLFSDGTRLNYPRSGYIGVTILPNVDGDTMQVSIDLTSTVKNRLDTMDLNIVGKADKSYVDQQTGDLNTLQTTDKDSLVHAINNNVVSLAQRTSQLTSQYINVKYPPAPMVAAVGDGITDDTSVIQACINYSSTRGMKVFFPLGNYLVSQLIWKSGIHLVGIPSRGATALGSKITCSGSLDCLTASPTDITNGYSNVSISGLSFWGVGSTSGHGLNLDGCQGFKLKDVYVQNFLGTNKNGIYLHRGANSSGYFTIEDAYLLYNYNNLYIQNLNGGSVKGGRIANATNYNLYMTGNYSIKFDNVPFEGVNSTDYLTYIYSNSQTTFDDCYFEKGYIYESNNIDIHFRNPHLNTTNTVFRQSGGASNLSKGRVVQDNITFGEGHTKNLLKNGHFSWWNNTTLLDWVLSGATVAQANNSELTDSFTNQITGTTSGQYISQKIYHPKKLLRDGKLKVKARIKGDADGTTLYRIRIRAHDTVNGEVDILIVDSLGATFKIIEQDIDLAAYNIQLGLLSNMDYITIYIYPNNSNTGTAKVCEVDWITLNEGFMACSPIPDPLDTYLYYTATDADPTVTDKRSGKLYFNLGSGKLRIYNGVSFTLLN